MCTSLCLFSYVDGGSAMRRWRRGDLLFKRQIGGVSHMVKLWSIDAYVKIVRQKGVAALWGLMLV